MLQWLRKYSRSWFIALVIGAIVVVFILWGVGGFKSPAFQEAAKVNGTPILMTAYVKHYHELVKQYQERTKGELTEETIKALHLKELALDQMIQEVLLLQAADRLGIRVSKTELQDHIRSFPFFQEDGHFSEKRYFWLLSRSRLSPVEFEENESRRLLMQKVYKEVTSFAKVSDKELQELFRLGREQVTVSYLVVTPDKFLARLNPGEAELAAYYQGHQAEFRQPERVKVNYLLLRPQDFLDRVKLTPEEVKNYLAEHTEEFYRPTVVRARQLLLTVSPKATAEERQKVEKLAQDLLERARSGEDFSRLAQQYSQDGRTRDRGGELGEVKRSEAQPEWAKVAFALKAGEVGLASTPQGFHLILVEEIKEKEKLPDAEAQARDRLREVKSRALAQETAQKAWEALPRSSLGEVAKKFGLTPKETPLLALKDPLPELGGYSKFNQAALKLKPGEIGRVLELPQGFIVLQGVDRRAEYLPPLPEVKEKVREAVKRQQAKGEAEKEAARLLDNLKKGEPLNRVAAQTGLSLNQSEPFTRFQGFLGQPLAEALTSAAFQLSSQQPYPAQPLFWKDKYYVLAFKARTAPNQEEFAREEDQLRKAALEQKREQIFTGWLNAERRRAKIKIYELL